MNRIAPVILLVLLVTLGSYVIFFELRPETRIATEAELKAMQSRVFGNLPPDAPDRVSLFTIAGDNGTLAFARAGRTNWMMTSPAKARARSGLVSGLAVDLLFMRKSTEDIPPSSFGPGGPAGYGLAHPRLVITLKGPQAEYVLRVGAEDPTRSFVYAQRPGESGVMVLDRRIFDALMRPASDFRETRFFAFDPRAVTGLKLTSTKTARLELKRAKGSDQWMIVRPFEDRADSLHMEDVLKAVASVDAKAFVSETGDNLRAYGLDSPRIRAVLSADNQIATLLIGSEAPSPVGTVYAKLENEPQVYAVTDDVVQALTFESEYLRDRHLAWMSPFDVREVLAEQGGRKLDMKKVRNAWKIAAPVKMDADDGLVDAFLRDLAGLDILRFPFDAPDADALKRCGLDAKDRLVITLRMADRPDQVYEVGAVDPQKKDLYIRRGGSKSVYTVKEGFAKVASADYLAFRTRRVVDINRFQIVKIVLHRPDHDFTIVKDEAGKWRLTAPVAAPAMEIFLSNLTTDIGDMQAYKLLADRAEKLSDYGLDKPTYELTVEMQEAKDKPLVAKTLLIGKDLGDDGFAAKMKDSDVIFTLAKGCPLMDHIGLEFRDRQIWVIRPERLTDIVWQKGDEKAVLRQEDGNWKLIEPTGRPINARQVTDMVTQLLYQVRIEHFDAYTHPDPAVYGLDKPSLVITVTAEGVPHKLVIGKEKDKDSYYAAVAGQDPVFTLPAPMVKGLLEGPVLKVEAPPAEAPKK